jgi:hypothetical protein
MPSTTKSSSTKASKTKIYTKKRGKPVKTKKTKAAKKVNEQTSTNNTTEIQQQVGVVEPAKRTITLKQVRAHDVQRATSILRIMPKIIKFYQKLTPQQIAAVKYYKGPGSFFQSELIADYNTTKGKSRELSFPFYKQEDKSFYRDILGQNKMDAIYDIELPAATNFQKYIEQSYGKRISILNTLDTVYDHKDCPKLIGNELLFRGMHTIPAIKKLKVGDTYTFKNFISTTLDRKVSENFARGDTIFVLTGLKDIPFIYMPNSKGFADQKYIDFIKKNMIIRDLSEITLPRNLEFEITSIEQRHLSSSWGKANKPGTIGQLMATLKKRGLEFEKETVEDGMFPKGTFIFARFKTWHPREPIDFTKIKTNAKFILDTDALETWREKDNEDD